MLKWALILAIASVFAGLLGFTGIAAGAASVAKLLFFICVAVVIVLLALALLGFADARK
ncbi:MAG: DUF1328 domain-containing protein [Burkholderiaceae bacterium]|nr:DUF1328 domain-containing protein [Burkholderiaceae bacterium]